MPRLLNQEQRRILLRFLWERFKIPEEGLAPYDMFAFSRQAFLFKRQSSPIKWPEGAFVRCGLPFLRNVAGFLKPTTVFIQRFGHFAQKNVMELSEEDVCKLCSDGELILKRLPTSVELPGYVIIKLEGHLIGAGLLLEENRLVCRFPKAMRQAFAKLTLQ